MPAIDVHAHLGFGEPGPEALARLLAEERFAGALPDMEWSPEAAIGFMDRQGTGMQLLSTPMLLDPAAAHTVNGQGAAVVAAHPSRFGLLAALPLTDPAAALAEVRYAYDELGADGVVLLTNYAGAYLGDPRFERVLAELDRREAVAFVHPIAPAGFDALSLGRPGPLIEFPMDTARTAVDLAFAGVLLRHPRIRLILAHGGGALPALVERIALLGAKSWVANPHGVTVGQLREQFAALYVDTAIAAAPGQTEAALGMAGPDHIVYGSDFPPAGIDVADAMRAALAAGPLGRDLARLDTTAARLFPRAAARRAA